MYRTAFLIIFFPAENEDHVTIQIMLNLGKVSIMSTESKVFLKEKYNVHFRAWVPNLWAMAH